jgi:DNA replication protein DnaC
LTGCEKCDKGTIILKDEYGEEYSDHCECVKNNIKSNSFEQSLLAANIPKDFWYLTTDNYRNPATSAYDKMINEINMAIIKRYIDEMPKRIETGTGLYLFGDNNTGKTMLMCIVLKEAIKMGYSVRFQTMSEIINGYMQSWFDKKDISVFKECHILGIDDSFDRRKTYTSQNNIQLSQLDDLFRYRVHNWKSMMITANISKDDLDNEDSFVNVNMTRLINRKMIELTFRGDFTKKLQERLTKEMIDVV